MVNLRVAFAIFFSGDVCLIGAIHLQASSEAETDSTSLRPVNWPDFFLCENRPKDWPEADWEASSEAHCLRPIGRPVQKPIELAWKIRTIELEKSDIFKRLQIIQHWGLTFSLYDMTFSPVGVVSSQGYESINNRRVVSTKS